MLKEKQADMTLMNSVGPLKDCQINRLTFSVSSLHPIKSILQSNPDTCPFKTLCCLTPAYRIKAKLFNKQTAFTNWPQDTFPDSYSLPSPTFPAVYTQYIAFLNYPFLHVTASLVLVVILVHHFFIHLDSRQFPVILCDSA